MPEVSAAQFNLEDKSPEELAQRRRAIVEELKNFPGSWEDPTVPVPLLQELAYIAGALRRKHSGPPKKAAPKRIGKLATVDDLMSMVE